MKMLAARVKAARASFVTITFGGSTFLMIREIEACGGSNSGVAIVQKLILLR
jgi:hypothetical protein